jgi:hypothetical protein
MLTVTVQDSETGRTAVDHFCADVFWWTEGNGSCDCNRELLFGGVADDIGECLGCRRFYVGAATGDLEGLTEAEFISRANDGYPDTLPIPAPPPS